MDGKAQDSKVLSLQVLDQALPAARWPASPLQLGCPPPFQLLATASVTCGWHAVWHQQSPFQEGVHTGHLRNEDLQPCCKVVGLQFIMETVFHRHPPSPHLTYNLKYI